MLYHCKKAINSDLNYCVMVKLFIVLLVGKIGRVSAMCSDFNEKQVIDLGNNIVLIQIEARKIQCKLFLN